MPGTRWNRLLVRTLDAITERPVGHGRRMRDRASELSQMLDSAITMRAAYDARPYEDKSGVPNVRLVLKTKAIFRRSFQTRLLETT